MAILASDIFRRAHVILQDVDAVRWPYPELREWLNDGLYEIALQKPNATAKTIILTLSTGTYQSVPEGYVSLIRVQRNLVDGTLPKKGGAAVTAANREIMDAQSPSWHDPLITPYQKSVVHVLADQADPRSFYVYPGNDGTGFVEATLSAIPTEIPAPDSTTAVGVPRYDDAGGVIAVPSTDPAVLDAYRMAVDIRDIYRSALVDYLAYRSFTKDSQVAGSTARAGSHYQLFQAALGIKQKTEAIANVNSTNKLASA